MSSPGGGVVSVIRHYTQIDPRSLGLFRLLFGTALIVDWAQRWDNRVAFYSNDGVLPNHAHLYHLKNAGRVVWSALHAFSTPGEAAVALVVILAFYVFFTLGFKTRVFHVLSIVGLVSLSARNTLAEGPGEALAIALAIATLFLPLGTAFSVDALLGKLRLARETKPKQLLDPGNLYTYEEVHAARLPGFSPRSIAAVGVLALVAILMLTLGKLQSGPSWKDGSALHRALNVFMIASPTGFSLRNSGMLGPLTKLLQLTHWLVPILIVVPLLRGITRGAAALLLVVYGATYALLTSYTLFGWCIMSAAALLLANDMWDRWAKKHDAKRARTVIFDVDCGICFWLSKSLRRFDSRNHLVFQGNGEFPSASSESRDLPPLLVRDEKTGKIVEREMPKGITSTLVEQTVVAVRPDGTFVTRGAAAAEIMRAIPGLGLLGLVVGLPLLAGPRDRLYDLVARKRTAISIELGLNACGVEVMTKPVALKEPLAPSKRLRFLAQAGIREVLAALFIGAILVQVFQVNDVGPKVRTKKLEPIAWWTRATGRLAVLSPEPPAVESELVVDAITKEGRKLDLMTGREPTISFDRPFSLRRQWATYLERVNAEENKAFSEALRRYFTRRGPGYETPEQSQVLAGVDAFWLTQPSMGEGPPEAQRLFRHARGGAVLNPTVAPLVKGQPPAGASRIPTSREPPRSEPEMDDDADDRKEPMRFPESPGQELE